MTRLVNRAHGIGRKESAESSVVRSRTGTSSSVRDDDLESGSKGTTERHSADRMEVAGRTFQKARYVIVKRELRITAPRRRRAETRWDDRVIVAGDLREDEGRLSEVEVKGRGTVKTSRFDRRCR